MTTLTMQAQSDREYAGWNVLTSVIASVVINPFASRINNHNFSGEQNRGFWTANDMPSNSVVPSSKAIRLWLWDEL